MTTWQRIPLAIKILIPSLMVAGLIAFSKPKPKPDTTPPPKVITEVDVIYAEPTTHIVTLESQGSIEARRTINLASQISGNIIDVSTEFIDGGFFNKGDVLLTLDDADYRIALARAEANLANAIVQMEEERGRAKQAKREWRNLGDKQANDLFLRKPQMRAAEQNVNAAKAEVTQAKLNIERTQITAPFDGRIQETQVDLGQFINASTAVATIIDTSSLQVRLPLTIDEATLIDLPLNKSQKLATPVTLRSNSDAISTTWPAAITRVASSIDSTSRLLSAIASIPATQDGDIPLLPGMFVTANIDSRKLDNVIKLPKSAVFKRNQIYIINNDLVNTLSVDVITRNDQSVWIRGNDIQPGTPIVIDRQNYLTEGSQVSIRKETVKETNNVDADNNKGDTP